jgi:hypothetical protein
MKSSQTTARSSPARGLTGRTLARAIDVRTSAERFRALDLQVHRVMVGVPLHDVSVIDLPGGGPGRTLLDLRSILSSQSLNRANPVVRMLFGLRSVLGRIFRWDRPDERRPESSFLPRLTPDLRARSLAPPGSADGPFSLLYLLENESLAELQNATAHAFIASVLEPIEGGYRLYWAVYVRPVSRLTPLYMAIIAPFRRFIVYPAIFRRIRHAWQAHYEATNAS